MNIKQIKNDLFGGITAGVVALPLAIAFGVQSGLGPLAGIYGAITLGMIAAIFGGTPTQISGPTGPMTVIATLIISNAVVSTGSLETALGTIMITFVLAGFMQICLGLSQVGKYIRFIPYPVISGFISGVGVVIILLQLFPLIGLDSPPEITEIIRQFPTALSKTNFDAVIIGFFAILLVYGLPRFIKIIPSSLLALTLISLYAFINQSNVPHLGNIPNGLPHADWKLIFNINYVNWYNIVVPAFTLALLGSIDSLLTSIVVDNITKTKHDSNRELIGQGLGNMVTSVIGGLPGAGATMQSVINISAGAKTRLSGITYSLLLLCLVFGAGPFVAKIPNAALAGLLITVGLTMIDVRGLKNLRKLPTTDSVVFIIVLLMTIFVDLLQAVFVGLVLSSLSFTKKMADIAEEQTRVGSLLEFEKFWSSRKRSLPRRAGKNIYVKHLVGPLFFGFTNQFQELVKAVPDVRIVVLAMDKVPYIDHSGIFAIREAIIYLESRGIEVKIVGLQNQPGELLKTAEIIPQYINEKDIFQNWPAFFDHLSQQGR